MEVCETANEYYSPEESKEDDEIINCLECGSENLVIDPNRGEKICANCGLINEDKMIDPGIEWRAFIYEERE